MTARAYRGRLLHVVETDPFDWEYFDDAVLLVNNGKVDQLATAAQIAADGFDLARCEQIDGLIIPGFIDTHVHSPQIDVIGSYGEQLLDWLNKYTFPAEEKYADESYAAQAAEDFLDGLMAAGTTTAMVYATSHLGATDQLFQAAHHRGLRLNIGKVLMDQNATPALHDTAEGGVRDSETLIQRWHGKGRLGYVITPRFAGSSTLAQLSAAGDLHRRHPDTWIQTHLSENLAEIAWLKEIHPGFRDYLDVYEQHGLLNDRAFFGHGIHLSDSELQRLADAGGVIAFCPTSNLFLGSGLMDLKERREYGVSVSLATDVGAGTSLCMLRTLGDAYKVCQLRGYALSAREAFGMATLGNARTMQLDDVIGNLMVGKEADFTVLCPGSNQLVQRRVQQANDVDEELFIYMTLGDEQCIAATYVAGELAMGT